MLKKLSLGNVAAKITGAVISSTGSQITYTTEDPHNLYEGARVTVVGLATNTGANIVNGIISQVPSSVTMIVNPTTAISSPGTQPTGSGTLYGVNGASANVKLRYAQPVVVPRPTNYNYIAPTISVVSNGTASNTITLGYSGVANPSVLIHKVVRTYNGVDTIVSTSSATFTDTSTFAAGSTVSYTYTISNTAGSVSASDSVIVLFINAPVINNISAVEKTQNRINFSWNTPSANTAITSYTITRSIDNVTFTSISPGTTTENNYTDNNATGGNTYYYKVQAIGTSATSNTSPSSGSVVPYYITDPANLVATATTSILNSVSLSWTASSGSNPANPNYVIERAYSTDNNTFGSWSALNSTNSTSYTDTTVADGTYYKYRIQAVNAEVSSNFITSSSVLPNYLPTPSAPNVSNQSTAVVISGSYTGNPEPSVVLLRRSSNGGSTWTTITTITPTVYGSYSYVDNTVAQNTSYIYQVQVQNNIATSAWGASSTSVLTLSIPFLPSPMITSVNPVAGTSDQLLISWNAATVNNAVTPITGYTLQRATNSGFTVNVTNISVSSSANTYTDTGRTIGTTYYYRMTATNSIGTTGYSNTASGAIVLINGTATVSVTTATAYYNSTVSLSANTNPNRSVQFQFSSDNSTWTNFGDPITSDATTGNITKISDVITGNVNTTVYYRIQVAQDSIYLEQYSSVASKTVTSNPLSQTKSASSTTSVTVTVTDVNGNTVSGATVAFTYCYYGDTTYRTGTSVTTNSSGQATYTFGTQTQSINIATAISKTNYTSNSNANSTNKGIHTVNVPQTESYNPSAVGSYAEANGGGYRLGGYSYLYSGYFGSNQGRQYSAAAYSSFSWAAIDAGTITAVSVYLTRINSIGGSSARMSYGTHTDTNLATTWGSISGKIQNRVFGTANVPAYNASTNQNATVALSTSYFGSGQKGLLFGHDTETTANTNDYMAIDTSPTLTITFYRNPTSSLV